MDDAAAIFDAHKSDQKFLCYASTLDPVTARHQFSNVESAKVLRCTLSLHHRGTHRDGACCWSPHEFSPNMAGPPEPDYHRWERCVECHQEWPCDVERLRTLDPTVEA